MSVTDFSRRTVDFSYDLYNRISKKNPNENVIISTFAVGTAVGLIYMGAGGKTATEISKGLRFGNSEKSTTVSNFKELLNIYKDGRFVKNVNKIYIGKNLRIRKGFNEIVRNQFYSEIENIDFENTDVVTETINKWVENKTDHKIKDFISSNHLNENTRMIIVIASHFQCDWEKPFSNVLTTEENFHISKTNKVKVRMMSRTDSLKMKVFSDLKAMTLEMNYKHLDLSMLFILPNDIDGLPEVEGKLLNMNLLDISKEMEENEVKVILPIFKIEFSIDLFETLSSMGMKSMFNDADFRHLSSEELKVSKVIHKAFLEVNEKGTEAGDATGVDKRVQMPPPLFRADRPFFFALKSKSNILFTGKYIKN